MNTRAPDELTLDEAHEIAPPIGVRDGRLAFIPEPRVGTEQTAERLRPHIRRLACSLADGAFRNGLTELHAAADAYADVVSPDGPDPLPIRRLHGLGLAVIQEGHEAAAPAGDDGGPRMSISTGADNGAFQSLHGAFALSAPDGRHAFDLMAREVSNPLPPRAVEAMHRIAKLMAKPGNIAKPDVATFFAILTRPSTGELRFAERLTNYRAAAIAVLMEGLSAAAADPSKDCEHFRAFAAEHADDIREITGHHPLLSPGTAEGPRP